MRDNEKIVNVNVENTKELSVRDAHLAVIDNLPKGFERVDFENPESILYYGHDDKQAISDILVNTAGLSIKQGKLALSDDMIQKLYTFTWQNTSMYGGKYMTKHHQKYQPKKVILLHNYMTT